MKLIVIVLFKFRDKSSLLTRRDFIFNSSLIRGLILEGELQDYFIDINITVVQIYNSSFEEVFIPKNYRLGTVQEYKEKGYYLVILEDTYLTINSVII